MSTYIYKGTFKNTQIAVDSETFEFLEDALEADQTVYMLSKEGLSQLEEQAETEEQKELVKRLSKLFTKVRGTDLKEGVITISIT